MLREKCSFPTLHRRIPINIYIFLFAYVFDTISILHHSSTHSVHSSSCSTACKMPKWANHHHQRGKNNNKNFRYLFEFVYRWENMLQSVKRFYPMTFALFSLMAPPPTTITTAVAASATADTESNCWWHIYFVTAMVVFVCVLMLLPFCHLVHKQKHIEPKKSRNHFYSNNNGAKSFSLFSRTFNVNECVLWMNGMCVCGLKHRKSQKFSKMLFPSPLYHSQFGRNNSKHTQHTHTLIQNGITTSLYRFVVFVLTWNDRHSKIAQQNWIKQIKIDNE